MLRCLGLRRGGWAGASPPRWRGCGGDWPHPCSTRSTPVEGAPRPPATPARPPELTQLSMWELCWLWRDGQIPTQHLPAVVLRERLLDELQRRDPVGSALWLLADPLAGSDPWFYLGSSHDPVSGLPEGCGPVHDAPSPREKGHHDGF